MKTVLSDKCQVFLRKIGLAKKQEVVYKFGDFFIAEDSITGIKRKMQKVTDIFTGKDHG